MQQGIRVTKLERADGPRGVFFTANVSRNGTTIRVDNRYGSWLAICPEGVGRFAGRSANFAVEAPTRCPRAALRSWTSRPRRRP